MIRRIFLLIVVPFLLHAQTAAGPWSVLSFTQDSSFIDLPYSPELNPRGDFTLEVWARHAQWGQHTLGNIVMARGAFTGVALFADGTTGRWIASVGNGTAWMQIAGPKIVPGAWTHLALVRSGTILTFLVNGIHAGSLTGAYAPNVSAPFRVGKDPYGAHFQWFGSFGEMRCWNKARTEDEIMGSMFSLRDPKDTALVLWWNGSGVRGNTIRDASGHGHEGRLFQTVREYSERPKGSRLLWIRNDDVSFPNIAPGTTQSKEVVLENRGTSPLTVTAIRSDRREIRVTPERMVIPPITTLPVTVTFAPHTAGVTRAQLTVHHDGLGGQTVFRATGSAGIPEITAITPAVIRPGDPVRITGKFLADSGGAVVSMGGLRVPLRSASSGELTFTAPEGMIAGEGLRIATNGAVIAPVRPLPVASAAEGPLRAGSFSRTAPIAPLHPVTTLAAADLDGDGSAEIITLSASDRSIIICPAGETRSDAAVRIPVSAGASELTVWNADGDARPDLAVLLADTGVVVLLRNVSEKGNVRFDEMASVKVQPGSGGLIAEDVDHDGRTDLLVAGRNDWTFTVLRNTGESGAAMFVSTMIGFWAKPFHLVTAPFNDDPFPDVAITTALDDQMTVLRTTIEQQEPGFVPQERHTASVTPGLLAADDLDGDGKYDLIAADRNGSVFLYRNTGTGAAVSFTDRMTIPVGGTVNAIRTADLNGDGAPELIVAGADGVTLFTNTAPGRPLSSATYPAGISVSTGDSVTALLVMDADRDGRPDIVTIGGRSGEMTILYNKVEHETDWQSVLLIGLAAVIVIGSGAWYLTNRRLTAKVRLLEHEQAIERERRRIARDLHDELGARLTEITYMAAAAKQDSRGTGTEEGFERIGDAARDVVDSFREIVWAVNPQQDSLDSLVEFLEQYAVRFLKTVRIRTMLEIPAVIPAMPLSSDARHSIFMAVKEALNNIAKHSGATEVRYSVTVEAERVTLSFRDNGRGFEQSSVHRFGNGLTTMSERLEVVGGTVTLTSAPGEGTAVHFIIPLASGGRTQTGY